jgi:hypothetical protein
LGGVGGIGTAVGVGQEGFDEPFVEGDVISRSELLFAGDCFERDDVVVEAEAAEREDRDWCVGGDDGQVEAG